MQAASDWGTYVLAHAYTSDAVRRLIDERFLAEVATRDPEPELRLAAIHRISEPSLLARVATDGIDTDVRSEAVRHISDRNLLAEIARREGIGKRRSVDR